MFHSIALLLAVLIAVGLTVMLVTAHLMAEAILRPPRMTDGKAVYFLKRLSPGDLGLKFSDVRLPVRDAAHPSGAPIELAAWWISAPSASEKCVVFIHGYADAKIGSIAWAPLWHSLGFNILAVDLRAHGESGGTYSTAGFFERHDMTELLDRLRSMNPNETRELYLFGLSMGAAVALATAALRADLTAIVLDSPFADYRTALRKNLDRLGLPVGLTARLALWQAQLISGANFAAVSPLALLHRIPCPIMLIRGEIDTTLTPTESTAIDQALATRADRLGDGHRDVSWIVPGTSHLAALQSDPNLYQEKIRAFLKMQPKSKPPA